MVFGNGGPSLPHAVMRTQISRVHLYRATEAYLFAKPKPILMETGQHMLFDPKLHPAAHLPILAGLKFKP